VPHESTAAYVKSVEERAKPTDRGQRQGRQG
jgi:hypothetical protein